MVVRARVGVDDCDAVAATHRAAASVARGRQQADLRKASRNSIPELTHPGIAVLANCTAVLTDNSVRKVAYNGVCTRGAATVTLKRMTIRGIARCAIAAVESYNIAETEVSGCDPRDLAVYGVQSYARENLCAHGDRMTNWDTACYVAFCGTATRRARASLPRRI